MTRTSIKVHGPRLMETAQEVDVALGAPEWEKELIFDVHTNAHRWANMVEIVGLKHSVTLGTRGPWAENRKVPSYEGGTHNLETGSLIGVPLNGKMFWRKRSDHTQ